MCGFNIWTDVAIYNQKGFWFSKFKMTWDQLKTLEKKSTYVLGHEYQDPNLSGSALSNLMELQSVAKQKKGKFLLGNKN